MATINKSDYWKDRRGKHGKGDLHQNGFSNYRDGLFFKRTPCCKAHYTTIDEKLHCEECGLTVDEPK